MANSDKRTRRINLASWTVNRKIDPATRDVETIEYDGVLIQWIHRIRNPRPNRRTIVNYRAFTRALVDEDDQPTDGEEYTLVLTGQDDKDFSQEKGAGTVALRLLEGKAARAAARNQTPKIYPPAPQSEDYDESNPDPDP